MFKNPYTELAGEARELQPDLAGVYQEEKEDRGVRITRTEVAAEAAEKLGKAPGVYVSLDAPELAARPLELFARVSKALCDELCALAPDIPQDAAVLAVGLGNRALTPDALGPRTIEQVFVTRHILQHMPEALSSPMRSVCAVAPGVLGVTGVETMEIVRGVVEHVQPALILAVDALASRRAARISTTIQLTDAGLCPGGGVGNARAGINADTFGIPVVALGVPTVVYAGTILEDALQYMAADMGLAGDEARLSELASSIASEHLDAMFVTPKDIDLLLSDMSRILADGINMALFGASFNEVRNLVT